MIDSSLPRIALEALITLSQKSQEGMLKLLLFEELHHSAARSVFFRTMMLLTTNYRKRHKSNAILSLYTDINMGSIEELSS